MKKINKICVIGNFFIEDSSANALNVIKLADAFAKLKFDTTLICKGTFFNSQKNIKIKKKTLGIDENLKFKLIKCSIFSYNYFSNILFLGELKKTLQQKIPDFVYTRQYASCEILDKLNIPFVVETHTYLKNKAVVNFLKNLNTKKNFLALITISKILKKYYTKFKINPKKIFVMHDSVDEQIFYKKKNLKKNFRKKIIYSGSLQIHKGIDLIIKLAKCKPQIDFEIYGGKKFEVAIFKLIIILKKIYNLKFYGRIDHVLLNNRLSRADILLIPNLENHPEAKITSPIKVFEYMMTGKPILSSDILALKEIGKSKFFFAKANNLVSFSKKIDLILKLKTKDITKKIRSGISFANKNTYKKKCLNILKIALKKFNY